MSGSNPFRRSKIITSDESLSSILNERNDAITPGTTTVLDPSSKPQSSSHPKVVRVATPPFPSPPSDSTSYFPAVSFTGIKTTHRGSPPPENDSSSESSDDSELDPLDPHPSGDVVTETDSSYHRRPQPIAEGTNLTDMALRSPPSGRSSYSRFATSEAKPLDEKANNYNNSLDVDAFTRLLLTGSAEASSNTTTTSTSQRAVSNPDTASDPVTPIKLGNSIDGSGANSSIESKPSQQVKVANTTGMSRVSTLPAKTESAEVERASSIRRPKPPPPRSHHGKPIKSGDSVPMFSKTSERETPDSTPTHLQTPFSSLADHRELLSSLSGRASSPTLSETSTADDASSLHRTSSQSKRPPTPPIARRRSQMKPNTKQSALERPNRLSLSSKSLSSQLPGPLSPGTGSKTPPRPPSRRHEKNVTGVQADSAPSQPRSSLSQGESTPSFNFSTDEQASTVSSSPSSRRSSVKQTPASSTTTTGGSGLQMPPPPPPPRRLRASSKSSNSSAQVPVITAATPIEKDDVNDNETSLPPQSSNAVDILADLSRLQREVDDLRVHYEGRKVSN